MKLVKITFALALILVSAFSMNMLFEIPILPLIIGLVIIGQVLQTKNSLTAVVSNPLIGHTRKSMGNATFSTWKGLDILKQKATSVANPKTPNQLMRRSAMKQVVAIFRMTPAAIKLGFKKGEAHMSEYNRFSKNALKNAFDFSNPPVATLNPANLLVSVGTITPTPIDSIISDRSIGTIVLAHSITIDGPGQSASDQDIAVVYNSTKNEWTSNSVHAARSTSAATVPMPANWQTGDLLEAYLAFYNPVSNDSSSSVSVGDTIVA